MPVDHEACSISGGVIRDVLQVEAAAPKEEESVVKEEESVVKEEESVVKEEESVVMEEDVVQSKEETAEAMEETPAPAAAQEPMEAAQVKFRFPLTILFFKSI